MDEEMHFKAFRAMIIGLGINFFQGFQLQKLFNMVAVNNPEFLNYRDFLDAFFIVDVDTVPTTFTLKLTKMIEPYPLYHLFRLNHNEDDSDNDSDDDEENGFGRYEFANMLYFMDIEKPVMKQNEIFSRFENPETELIDDELVFRKLWFEVRVSLCSIPPVYVETRS